MTEAVAGDWNPCQQISDLEQFCQGDILHRNDGTHGGAGTFAVVLTADCDIAQGKDGGAFTVLNTVPAEYYIQHDWAASEVAKTCAKQRTSALAMLNAAIGRQDAELDPLTPEALTRWLEADAPEDIVTAVGLTTQRGPGADAVRALHCLCDGHWTGTELPMDALRRVWARLETSARTIQGRLSDSLHPSRGASDIHFVPHLPDVAEIGFVIQLRNLSAVPRESVHKSRMEARINGQAGDHYRIGRFRDGVKYAIVHQVVTLFSRVGLSDRYEEESSSAADMVVSGLYPQMTEATR